MSKYRAGLAFGTTLYAVLVHFNSATPGSAKDFFQSAAPFVFGGGTGVVTKIVIDEVKKKPPPPPPKKAPTATGVIRDLLPNCLVYSKSERVAVLVSNVQPLDWPQFKPGDAVRAKVAGLEGQCGFEPALYEPRAAVEGTIYKSDAVEENGQARFTVYVKVPS